jgi:hypothetical protein
MSNFGGKVSFIWSVPDLFQGSCKPAQCSLIGLLLGRLCTTKRSECGVTRHTVKRISV